MLELSSAYRETKHSECRADDQNQRPKFCDIHFVSFVCCCRCLAAVLTVSVLDRPQLFLVCKEVLRSVKLAWCPAARLSAVVLDNTR